MTIDISNQITNLLRKYMPFTGYDIGWKFLVDSVVIDEDLVTLTLPSENYDVIKAFIDGGNNSFVTSGFYIKNNITIFKTEANYPYYFFDVSFENFHNLSNGQTIELKGFTDIQYNTTYKVIEVKSTKRAILFNEDISFVDVSSGLGFLPVQYTEGFNDIVNLTDEGSNQVSFLVDNNMKLYVDDASKLDLDFDIYVHYYQDHIKPIDFETFSENIADNGNEEYIIIDTASLVGRPFRSRNQSFDNDYYSTNRGGMFSKNFTLNINYLLNRKTDDNSNQTSSGSDIIEKQIEIHKILTSILNTNLKGDEKIDYSAPVITDDGVSDSIVSGKTVITYALGFVATYYDKIMVKANNKVYDIKSLKINDDVLNF